MIVDENFAFVITQGIYKAALRRANREIMRQVVDYCFHCFVYLYRLSVCRLVSLRMNEDLLSATEAEALVATKDLLASGRHRAHAALPVTRLCGPLLAASEAAGINFLTLLKKTGQRTKYIEAVWSASDNYPA